VPDYRRMADHLETERLILRPWALTDAEDLSALHAERGDGTPAVDEMRELIARALVLADEWGFATLPIRRRDAGDFIGYCGLIVGRSTVDEPEIAFELRQRDHGNGYATESARAVLAAAAATGRTRLWATVRSWNAPSFRVLDKLDFTRDHTTTDDRGELVWLTRALPAA